jgi:hypothetical protein
LGTLSVGGGPADSGEPAGAADSAVEFQELLNTLSKLQLQPEQMVSTIEHLHNTGTLHAQLIYTE